MKQVWKAGLVLCEESAVAAGKDVAAMKAEKKAREKVKQAAKKASAAAAAGAFFGGNLPFVVLCMHVS